MITYGAARGDRLRAQARCTGTRPELVCHDLSNPHATWSLAAFGNHAGRHLLIIVSCLVRQCMERGEALSCHGSHCMQPPHTSLSGISGDGDTLLGGCRARGDFVSSMVAAIRGGVAFNNVRSICAFCRAVIVRHGLRRQTMQSVFEHAPCACVRTQRCVTWTAELGTSSQQGGTAEGDSMTRTTKAAWVSYARLLGTAIGAKVSEAQGQIAASGSPPFNTHLQGPYLEPWRSCRFFGASDRSQFRKLATARLGS